MTDIKISQLTPAQALGGGELLPAVQDGSTVAVTPAQLLSHVLADPVTIAAVGAPHPGYVPGLSYCPPYLSTPSGVAVTPDTLYAIPMPIARPCTIAGIGFRVTLASAGSAQLGLYASADGGPRAKIAQGAAAPSTGASVSAELAFAAPLAVAPGLYWLAAMFSGTPTIHFTGGTERGFTWMIGASGTFASGNTQSSGVIASQAVPFAGGLPATFGPFAPAVRVPLLTITTA
jgi:hypothetical protein